MVICLVLVCVLLITGRASCSDSFLSSYFLGGWEQ